MDQGNHTLSVMYTTNHRNISDDAIFEVSPTWKGPIPRKCTVKKLWNFVTLIICIFTKRDKGKDSAFDITLSSRNSLRNSFKTMAKTLFYNVDVMTENDLPSYNDLRWKIRYNEIEKIDTQMVQRWIAAEKRWAYINYFLYTLSIEQHVRRSKP